jgi:hypothetical protein
MKSQVTFGVIIATVLTTFSIGAVAKADTVSARCDIYPRGEDRTSAIVPCTFSQRQGYVTIVLEDGTTYELSPSPSQAAIYTDQDGRPATREDGLGAGLTIYRLAEESIYVYWDAAIDSSEQTNSSTQSSEPVTYVGLVTYVTDVQDEVIVMQITESGSEFRFHGYLERTTGNTFQGEDDNVRVIYERDTGHVVVINRVTGDEFYNYFYSEEDEGAL